MRFLSSLIFVLFLGFCASAQTVKPIKWTFSLSSDEVKQGGSVEVIMKAVINTNWYLYSSDFNPELGPTVTTISFEGTDGYKVVGKLKPIGAKEKYDSLWEGKIRYFVNTAEFRQEIKILSTKPVINGTLIYQVCSDKEGKCIPYEEKIYFDNLRVTAAATIPKEQIKVEEIKVDNIKKVNIIKDTAVSVTSSKGDIKSLEAEKEKLVKKDRNGNDLAVEQLREFTKKYGGTK